MLRSFALAILALAAALPSGARAEDPLTRIGRDLRLSQAVASFYDARAQEGGYNCPGVRMDGITRSEPLRREAGRVLVAITYWHTMDATPPDPFSGARCNGFATRVFTLAELPGGRYDVVAMTGEQVE